MRFQSVLGGLGILVIAAAAASAAPATPEQAQSVKASLERFVGRGDDSGSSPVSVTPDGDHYAITIDLKRALRGLETFGVTLEPASYAMVATPLDGGTWHVTNNGLPRITVKHGEDSYSVVVNGMAFDGTFDPRIPGFQSSTLTYDSMSIAAVGTKGGTQTREIDRGKQTSTTTLTGDGTSNVQLLQSNDGFAQDITLDVAPAKNGALPNKISLKSGSTSQTLAIDELHSRALSELWAFFVAHPNGSAVKASQTEFRGLLRQALPLFDRWSQGGSAERVVVESPFGPFTLQSLGGTLKVTGLVAQGQVESEVRFDGLTIPSGLVPGWGDGLVPTTAEIKENFSGFHLDEAARQAVDAVDLDAKEPFTPEMAEKLKTLLGPLDQMVLKLAPSHIASKLLDVHLDGDVRFRMPVPDFHVNIRATGVDKAIQEIQSKAAGDKNATQLITVMVLAKGLGKAEPDGTLSWAVTEGDTGEIVVNGLAMPGSSGK